MKHQFYTDASLRQDLPQHGLKHGDVVSIIDSHPHPQKGEQGYSIEVFNALGETIAVTVVAESLLEPCNATEVQHVRQLHKTA